MTPDPLTPDMLPTMLADRPLPRNRFVIAGILVLVIILGLASRRLGSSLPTAVADHAGDALWTVAVYLAIAFAAPRLSPVKLGIAALAISFTVEFSQLWDPPWLHALRKTLPGRLLLGSGFLGIDLLRYTAGALIATTLDTLIASRSFKPGTAK